MTDEEDSVAYCRASLSFGVSYMIVWTNVLCRILFTNYLNVNFSRNIDISNQQFFMIFNEVHEEARREVDRDI